MEIGKVSGNVLKRSVLGQVSTRREEVVSGAGIGADCAIFSCVEEEKLVTCMQEAAVHWAAPRSAAMKPELRVHRTKSETLAYEVEHTKSEMLAYEVEHTKSETLAHDLEYTNPETLAHDLECTNPETLVHELGRTKSETFVQESEPTKSEPYMTLAQLIQKCANNIAAGGAEPVALLLTLLLPEHTEESDIKALMSEAGKKCRELSMVLTGGQTRITGQVISPFAVAAGYGKVEAEDNHTVRIAAPGQDIIISKWIGLQGTAVLAKRNREKLLERYPFYLVEEALGFDRYLSVIPEAAAAVKSGVCAMHDASEGGIFAALWELAEGAGVGLNIDMRKLPLRQETVEVCECCNVNPYELLSGGCLIMTANDGQGLVEALAAEHIPAVIVGRVTEGKGRILRNGEEIRYLDRPKQDQIYKIQ